ncbi:MAG: GDSL-type esterase/lipase family protein [Acidobacteria bacterium]|nr:GDSL-type esterase/lipase family protein [Acidobacteriota bacterium]
MMFDRLRMFNRLRLGGLVATLLVAGCSSDAPTAPTPLPTPGAPMAALMSCPVSVSRQSLDALPVSISYERPTVAGIPVDKGSCAPVSGTAFPIGTSTVTCTADFPEFAESCSFSIAITPPDEKLAFTRYMAFGDSITEGRVGASFLPSGVSMRDIPAMLRAGARQIPGIAHAIEPLSAYPTLVHNMLALAYPTQQFVVANRGLAGERAAQGVLRINSALLATQPDVLMLFEGYNDINLALLERPLGSTADVNVTPIANALRSIITTAQGHGVEVLLATLTPVSDRRELSDPGTRAALRALNAQIRLIAAQFGLGTVVDLYAALDGVPGVLGADGFHPTRAGYRRMAELFAAEIISRYDITPRAPAMQGTR